MIAAAWLQHSQSETRKTAGARVFLHTCSSLPLIYAALTSVIVSNPRWQWQFIYCDKLAGRV